jgi:transposase
VLRLVGEDVAEILDFIAAELKVIEIHRPKKSCRDCERMVQSPAPPRPIPRGLAGPSLLAHILVTKFDDHVPLYRQGAIFARLGADIPRSTLIDWCGQAAGAVRPIANLIRAEVMAADRLHADDTPIRVLDPKMKLPRQGAWRQRRPGVGLCPRRSPPPRPPGRVPSAACWPRPLQGSDRRPPGHRWAHLRRDFHDVWKSTDSAIARDALEQIGKLYDVERAINGQSLDRRLAARQQQSRPLVLAFRTWCEQQQGCIPGKSDLAKAMRYALGRWPSFTLFLDDARVAIDNNAAERAIRPISIGRKISCSPAPMPAVRSSPTP